MASAPDQPRQEPYPEKVLHHGIRIADAHENMDKIFQVVRHKIWDMSIGWQEEGKKVRPLELQLYINRLLNLQMTDASWKIGVLTQKPMTAEEYANPRSVDWSEAETVLLNRIYPAVRRGLQQETGLPLEDVRASTVGLLRQRKGNFTPQQFTQIGENMRRHPEKEGAVLVTALRFAKDARRFDELMEFAQHPAAIAVMELYEKMSGELLSYYMRRYAILMRLGIHNVTSNPVPKDVLKRADLLLSMAMELVKEHGNDTDHQRALTKSISMVCEMFWKESERVRLNSDVMASMPRQQWSAIEIKRLDGIELRAPVPATLVEAGIKKEIRKVTNAAFKENKEDFARFLQDDKAYLCYAECDDELIASIGALRLPGGVLQLDYMCMNSHNELRGLMEAVVIASVHEMESKLKPEGIYCAVKAHMRSGATAIEDVGGVAYGLVGPPKEAHTYMQVRRIASEADRYIGKQLSLDEIQELVPVCTKPNERFTKTIRGKECEVALIRFHQKGPKDDRKNLTKEEDGIYRWIEEYAGAKVLTRYVPLDTQPGEYAPAVQTYFAIFEETDDKTDLKAFNDSVAFSA